MYKQPFTTVVDLPERCLIEVSTLDGFIFADTAFWLGAADLLLYMDS